MPQVLGELLGGTSTSKEVSLEEVTYQRPKNELKLAN